MAQGKVGKLLNADIDAIEDIAVIDVSGFKSLWLEFALGVASLTAFTVEYRLGSVGNWMPMAAAGADYTTPTHPVLKASAALPTAGVGNHFLKLDITGVHSVRIRAAGASSTINGMWSVG